MKYAIAEGGVAPSRVEIDGWLRLAAAFPRELEARLRDSSDAELRTRASDEPGAFSLHEQVWHLRDIEIGGYALRFRAVVAHEHPFLPDIDGTRVASERAYAARPLWHGFDDFTRARARNVEFLRTLAVEQFERAGELEGAGCVTLARLVGMWRAHDDGHIAEIDALRRALGR